MTTESAPVEILPVGVGGVHSFKAQWPFYIPLLRSPGSDLPSSERFLPIPDRGKSPFDEMYGQLEANMLQTHERIGARIALYGHSLGGLMATMMGLRHPDKVASVTCLAGAQEGVKTMTPTGTFLKWSLGNPKGAEDIRHNSDFMKAFKDDVATNWSPDTTLHLVSPTYDDLLLMPQGLNMELPPGQKPERLVVAPPIPGLGFLLRRVPGMPKDVKILPSAYPVGHVDIAVSPAVISHTRAIRKGTLLKIGAIKPAIGNTGSPQPVAA